MEPEHVTAGEFERWMRHLDSRFDSVEAAQSITNGRVSKLEVDHRVVKRIAVIISAVTGFIVSFVIWVISLFRQG